MCTLSIGTVVRAPRRQQGKCRATVATISKGTVCLLWEPLAPAGQFILCPPPVDRSEEEEVSLPLAEVHSLLPFESDETTRDSEKLKNWADQLMRLGDPSAAIPFYERALQSTSSIDIGGRAFISPGLIMDIDCIEDTTCDGNIESTGEEKVVPLEDVILGVAPKKGGQLLQLRILLNLTRCLLKVAAIEVSGKKRYRQAAVLASNMAWTLSSKLEAKDYRLASLQLRALAQAALSRWPMALRDAREVSSAGGGEQCLNSIQRQRKLEKKLNKQLAKEVSRWVQTATVAWEEEAHAG